MEPVYCPNGHPNRPGTRICAVCRALLEPSAPVVPPRKTSSSPKPVAPPRPAPSLPPEKTVSPAPTDLSSPQSVTAPSGRSRLWVWLLLFVLFAVLAVVAVLAAMYPVMRTAEEATTVAVATLPVTAAASTILASPPGVVEVAGTASPEPTETTAADGGTPTVVATITPLEPIVGIVITPTFGAGANFIQNGDFADDWVNGWTREESGNTGIVEVRTLEGDQSVPALYLEKIGAGQLRVAQRIVPPFPVEGLTFRARIHLTGSSVAGAEGRSALILRFEDVNGDLLGSSVWLDGSSETTGLWGEGSLPSPGPTAVYRFVGEDWQTIELDLGRELAEELPGIDPIAVRQITVLLTLASDDTCSSAACETMLEAAGLSLTAEMP